MYEAIVIINCLFLMFYFSQTHNMLTDFNKNSYFETFVNRFGEGSTALKGQTQQNSIYTRILNVF